MDLQSSILKTRLLPFILQVGLAVLVYETYQAVVGYKGVKFILIKKIVYDYQDKNGNYIGCHIYTYDVVNGREVLIESESGPVDL